MCEEVAEVEEMAEVEAVAEVEEVAEVVVGVVEESEESEEVEPNSWCVTCVRTCRKGYRWRSVSSGVGDTPHKCSGRRATPIS